MKRRLVLDSHALLKLYQKEPGYKKVKKLLRDATKVEEKLVLNLVNLGEFFYITKHRAGEGKTWEAIYILEQLPIEIYPVSKKLTLQAANLKAEYRIPYADAFCVATSLEVGGDIISGDPDFRSIEHLVPIIWV